MREKALGRTFNKTVLQNNNLPFPKIPILTQKSQLKNVSI